jgi:CheY-like chemotaxis protein
MREAKRPAVMIVDGYEDTRALLRFWFEAEGYGVLEAANGKEAVELTRDVCSDLIPMSERMPMLGGLEAARHIRQRGKESVFPVKECVFPIAAACWKRLSAASVF